jgi:hypothetical protein
LLNDVVANFLGTLSELEFFDAFAAILRANGFYDVHLLHGATEYGKDFIAKRMVDSAPIQFAIQTKVGDINASGWHAVRNQIETIRLSTLSHPSDDLSLPRRAVLALTGRLVGLAPAESQDYKRRYDTATFEFEVWQLDDLLSMMTDAPEAGLAGEPDAPLLGAVAAIYEGTFAEADLEALSRGWANPVGETTGIWRSALSAFVLAHRLALHGRRDLAALAGAHLVRSAWGRCDNAEPPPNEVLGVADAGRGLLMFHSQVLFDEVRALPENPEQFIMATASFGDFVVYPVRCMRILELLGLMGMATEDADLRRQIAEFCATFIDRHPGASHPISDHWAVCIPPAALLIHEVEAELVGKWLQEVCVWVVDHYEPGKVGLGQPWTAPDEEVVHLLMGVLPGANVDRRPDSFLAAVLIDLAASLELGGVYDSLVNEVMAVRMFPTVVQANEGVGFYQDNFGDVFIEPWVQYDGKYADYDGWECSEPHRNLMPCYLQRIGRSWDLLALSSVLRDRWFPLAWRGMKGMGT